MPIFSTTLSESGPFTIPDNATLTRTMSFGTTSWARITRISVGLGSLMHTFADDLDFLILGPDGRNLAFWSDAGGSSSINGSYTIADTGAAALSDSGANAPGTYRPTDYATGGEAVETSSNWSGVASIPINHPGPTGSASFGSAFGGTWVTNTTWTLKVRMTFRGSAAASQAGASRSNTGSS